MEYVVTHSFTDKDTKEHYAVGDRYPHRGFGKKDRIAELSSENNKRGIVLIESVKEKKTDESVTEVVSGLVTRDEVEKMKYMALKSVATKNGIDPEGKKAVELRAEIIEKLKL